MKSKTYTFSLTDSLKRMQEGEVLVFITSGARRQCSIQAIYMARKKLGLDLSIKQTENGTKAVVMKR